MPISEPSPIVHPCSITRWPTETEGPRISGTPASVCSTEPSWMFDRAPTVIVSLSPRMTTLNHTEDSLSSTTSPMRVALGAT